jgi:hypothetical protein
MTPPKSNKTLVRSLLALLVCIWGAVAYQVVDTVTRLDADPDSGPRQDSENRGRARYVYQADVQDPFSRTLSVSPSGEARRKLTKAAKPAWVPPPITLAGILTHQRRSTAVLVCADGSTHFAAQGDTLLGARVLKVRPKAVAYLFNRKKAEWTLP